MKYKVKINLKTILLFEQLTDMSYLDIEYDDVNNLTKLAYCSIINNNNVNHTYDTFVELLRTSKKVTNEIFKELQSEIEYMSQFYAKKHKDVTKKESNIKISDIIPILVTNCELDVNYVMYDMQLWEMDMYITNFNRQEQNRLELDRLWAYLTILPHCGKNLKSPKDLIKFNWEEQGVDISSITTDDFDSMINSAPKFNKE